MLRVMRNHRRAAYDAPTRRVRRLAVPPRHRHRPGALPGQPARGRPHTPGTCALELGEEHGYRNAQTTLLAPTGTIGLLMDCDTTGVEPDFALVKFKKLAGGGYFKIANQSIAPALHEPRLHRARRSSDIIDYVDRHPRACDGAPHINRRRYGRRASPTRTSTRSRRRSPGVFELRLRLQRVGRSARTRCAGSGSRSREQYNAAGFNLLRGARLHPAADREANDAHLRHADDRGCPAPAATSTCRCSTPPTRTAGSASGSSTTPATSR